MAEYTITFKDFVTEEGTDAVELLIESDIDQSEMTQAGLFTVAVVDLFNTQKLAEHVTQTILKEEENTND